MTIAWYPLKKEELQEVLDNLLSSENLNKKNENINGIIVPHAGYQYSGQISGKAFSLLKGRRVSETAGVWDKAIILAPSHYISLGGIVSHNEKEWQTPLGNIKIMKNDFRKMNLNEEHSIDNQIPFLQKLKFKEILPLMIGNITKEEAEIIANKISEIMKKEKAALIISTDLSHFNPYEEASVKDKKTIKIIENIDIENASNIDACGFYPLLIFLDIAKLNNLHPKLLEYKNSGDITGDRASVVGYASFSF